MEWRLKSALLLFSAGGKHTVYASSHVFFTAFAIAHTHTHTHHWLLQILSFCKLVRAKSTLFFLSFVRSFHALFHPDAHL